MSISRLEEIVAEFAAENRIRFAEAERRAAENDKRAAEMKAESDRRAAEAAANIARLDRMIEEVRETNARLEVSNAELKVLSGRYGWQLGQIVEFTIIPGIRPILSRHGHSYDNVISNKVVWDGEGKKAAEVDLLLDNGTEAMAVEIKTCIAPSFVDSHIKRLQRLRENEESAGVKGKTLYGALAGIIIDDYVEKHALKSGLYVIEIVEDEERLEVRAPETAAMF